MTKKRKLILLAEDDDSHRFLFNKTVSQLPIDAVVINVKDGVDLLSYLEDDTNDIPDLIFLDINMPRMNGLECLKKIREDGYHPHVPIIIYSTSDEDRDRAEASKYNATLYLVKDGNNRSLARILIMLLSGKTVVDNMMILPSYDTLRRNSAF